MRRVMLTASVLHKSEIRRALNRMLANTNEFSAKSSYAGIVTALDSKEIGSDKYMINYMTLLLLES
jgi:hypothetical protein